ncbi:FKBP-type peptidyl-prolyl cis-trans isomerase [Mycolicibacillus trivialis]
MPSLITLAIGTTSLVVALTGCGSDSDTSASPSPSISDAVSSSTTQAPAVAASCPTAAPVGDATPQWTLSGATGSVAVTGSTDTAAPVVTVEAPFSVTETQVETLEPGDGPVVADTATVSVCYMGVNGRDGNVFDSSYERGEPVEFPLDRVVPGFQKAIAGQTVGSSVAVAMVPDDGYPNGEPRADIAPGDTLIFAIKILDASA